MKLQSFDYSIDTGHRSQGDSEAQLRLHLSLSAPELELLEIKDRIRVLLDGLLTTSEAATHGAVDSCAVPAT